jgi:putative OPT family oligopeptide transporter
MAGSSPAAAPYIRTDEPQLTLRAVATGVILGSVLSWANIYSGLKIGWGFNMSITAVLLGLGFWEVISAVFRNRRFGILENNLNQTAASAGAAISSAGLVAAVPAWTILTGNSLSYAPLALWVLSVGMLGVLVAIAVRRQMLVTENLPFPSGVATAETLKQLHAKGSDAMPRVLTLMGGLVVGAAVKVVVWWKGIKPFAIPGDIAVGGALEKLGLPTITFKNMGFLLDPSLLLFAIGGIIGTRAGISLMLGGVFAWGWLGPHLMEWGWTQPGKPDAVWYKETVEWLLWPGVSMMVAASLTSFAFSGGAIVRSFRGRGGDDEGADPPGYFVSGGEYRVALAVVAAASILCQVLFFNIHPLAAALAVALSFVLAVVAGRVSGETGVTPVGPMGKITQLTFGVVTPGDVAANLQAANVTGGAASQCADLLHDMKTGMLVGAVPRNQAIAQACGVVGGALVGTLGYLVLVPDPAGMLITTEWPAPAVMQWKAVAQVLSAGVGNLPHGALNAMGIAAAVGIALAIAEKLVPKNVGRFIPSPSAFGLAFSVPFSNSLSMFLGAMLALLLSTVVKSWSARFLIVIISGLIAGESLAGVGTSIYDLLAPKR